MFENEKVESAPSLRGENVRTIRSIVPTAHPAGARPSCLSAPRRTLALEAREGVEGVSGVWRAHIPLPAAFRALWGRFWV